MNSDKLVRYKSGISKAFWCDTSDNLARFQEALIAFDNSGPQTLSWFDQLLEGGILLPESNGDTLRPLTMLVSGPPGCGKTTLITELCYRLAVNQKQSDGNNLNPKPLSTLYICTDADTGRLIHNAIDLGWDQASDYFIPFDPADKKPQLKTGLRSMIAVWGREKFMKSVESQDILSSMIEAALNSLDQWVIKAKTTDFMTRLKFKMTNAPIESASGGGVAVYDEKYIPDILVVDSLNILDPEGQTKFFQAFVKACKATKLVIFMLNTGDSGQNHKLWEYFSDIVVQLDYEYSHNYYVRTIEIVKARYQAHRWGKHQLKIYANPAAREIPAETDLKAIQDYNTTLKRAHPYRPAGGVFIFPSIHSYLSVYKRKTAAEKPSKIETFPEKLNTVFTLPRGRCTAFIGERGGHKSHLAYLHVLYRLIHHQDESGLIISLREDEATTKETLATIAEKEFNCSRKNFDHLEKSNHLEILYFPPGYITPEEFFHRMFISIHRLKRQKGPLTVMFNSLDQISARFPLCAKQEIFIPGIIQTLSGEGVTSICIAVDEPGQPEQKYGLLPMADLIVSFALRRFSAVEYYNHINNGWQAEFKTDEALEKKYWRLQKSASDNPALKREAVVLQVIRFSGGQRAGKRGILELVDNLELDNFPYPKVGLHFTPLNEELPQGELVSGSDSLLKRLLF